MNLLLKIKIKNMANKNNLSYSSSENDYSLVYYYLLAGIGILLGVVLFLPQVSIG